MLLKVSDRKFTTRTIRSICLNSTKSNHLGRILSLIRYIRKPLLNRFVMQKIIYYCCIVMCISTNAFSQDSLNHKNALYFIPTSLLNRTLAFSYYRTISVNNELSLHAGFRIPKAKVKNLWPVVKNPYSNAGQGVWTSGYGRVGRYIC